MNPTFYVKAKNYRGRDGWHVGSRGLRFHPVSIWVPTYDQAVRIRAVFRESWGVVPPWDIWDAVDKIIREQP